MASPLTDGGAAGGAPRSRRRSGVERTAVGVTATRRRGRLPSKNQAGVRASTAPRTLRQQLWFGGPAPEAVRRTACAPRRLCGGGEVPPPPSSRPVSDATSGQRSAPSLAAAVPAHTHHFTLRGSGVYPPRPTPTILTMRFRRASLLSAVRLAAAIALIRRGGDCQWHALPPRRGVGRPSRPHHRRPGSGRRRQRQSLRRQGRSLGRPSRRGCQRNGECARPQNRTDGAGGVGHDAHRPGTGS